MRIAIVDDSAEDRAALRAALLRWAEANQCMLSAPEEYDCAEALLADGAEPLPDLIFLDIFMGGMTGMEAARRIRERRKDCCIIFLTYSPDHAVESYDVQASYYLLKPCRDDLLAKAMERCGSFLEAARQTISVPGRFGEEKLLLPHITYAEYGNRRVTVHFADGQETQVNLSWNEFLAKVIHLPYLCDCMKGMLVNFNAVSKLTNDSFLLNSGLQIPISRLKYRDVRQAFFDWMFANARNSAG